MTPKTYKCLQMTSESILLGLIWQLLYQKTVTNYSTGKKMYLHGSRVFPQLTVQQYSFDYNNKYLLNRDIEFKYSFSISDFVV